MATLWQLAVFVRRPLGQQQRVAAVRFRRRLPQRALICAEADEEHAHALLRHCKQYVDETVNSYSIQCKLFAHPQNALEYSVVGAILLLRLKRRKADG